MQFVTGVRPAIAPFGRTSPSVGSSRLVCVFLLFLMPKSVVSGGAATAEAGTAAST